MIVRIRALLHERSCNSNVDELLITCREETTLLAPREARGVVVHPVEAALGKTLLLPKTFFK